MWGLYWIPVTYLSKAGATGVWPGILLYGFAMLVLAPVAWARRHVLRTNWRTLAVAGLFTGASFSLFTVSLSLTDVVRAILLFYLTPIWGTVLAVTVLGHRLTMRRVLALSLGLTGMVIVLGLGQSMPWPRNAGDWLGLLSGLIWAVGALKLYQGGAVNAADQVMAFLLGGLVVSFAVLFLAGPSITGALNPAVLGPVLVAAALFTLFVVPMVFLTIWPATLLEPGRVGLLMMSEVVVGVISAALLSGQVFGWREAIGAILIVSGALFEVLGPAQGRGTSQAEAS